MAVTRYWIGGAGDGNFTTLANWSDSATALADGDTYIFPSGAVSVTAGLSNPTLDNIIIIGKEGYVGSVGSASAPLLFGSCASISWAGRGTYAKFAASTASAGTGIITICTAKLAAGNTLYISAGTGCTVTDLNVNGVGNVDIDAAAIVTNLRTGSKVVVDAAAGTAFTLVDNAGTLNSSRNVGTYRGDVGSTLNARGSATATAIYAPASSTINWGSTGTITAIDLCNGATFGVLASEMTSAGFTITTLRRRPGATINRYPPGVTLTITNEFSIGYD